VAIVVRNKRVVNNIWLIIFLIALCKTGYGQQGSINLQKMVVVQSKTIPLDSLLHLIKRQTGVKFSINTRKIPPTKLIRIKNARQPIEGVLQEIKQNTGVYYAILGDHIILLDNPPPARQKEKSIHPIPVSHSRHKQTASTNRITSPIKKTTVKKTVATRADSIPAVTMPQDSLNKKTGSNSNPVPLVNILPQPIADSPLYRSVAGDTVKAITADDPKKDITPQPPVRKRSDALTSQSKPASKNKTEKQPFISNVFVKAGIAAGDIFYCSPTLQFGIPYIYGIASWNSNFTISGLRYGVGGSIPLSDQWKLHLQLTTGNLSSKFDTIPQSWEFKTRLHRAALIAETNLGNRFTIQFGPIVNVMKWTFYRNGVKSPPGISTMQVDQKFNLIQPVYTISDNYSMNASKSTKTWIGLQVCILYNFNFYKKE
jgi:hypothetical protein